MLGGCLTSRSFVALLLILTLAGLTAYWMGLSGRASANIFSHLFLFLAFALILTQKIREIRYLRDYYVPDSTPFFVRETQVELEILDDNGDQARYEKRQTCQVLRDGITGYRLTNIFADGNKPDFCATGKSDDPAHAELILTEKPNSYEARVQLKRAYRKGEIIERGMNLVFQKSFCNSEEFFRISFINPTRDYSMIMKWPNGYHIDHVWVEHSLPIEENIVTTRADLVINYSDNQSSVTMRLYKPKVGSTATVRWKRSSSDTKQKVG